MEGRMEGSYKTDVPNMNMSKLAILVNKLCLFACKL